MPIKRRLQHLKAARAASVESFKKRRLEASSLPNSARLQIDNDKLSTGDTSDTDGESGIWFWNENANETNSDFEDKDVDEDDWEEEQSRTEQAVSPKPSKTEIRWNKEGGQNLRLGYGRFQKEPK